MNHAALPSLKMYWWPGMELNGRLLRLIKAGGVNFSWRYPHVKNFGDQLAPLIVSLLSGRSVTFSKQAGAGRLLSLGSILHFIGDGDVVWGSGLAKAADAECAKRAKGVKILAVRGPRTRTALNAVGVDCPEAYGDPALLLPQLVTNDVGKQHAVGIVPHFQHHAEVRKQWMQRGSGVVKLINVTAPCADVVRDILSCEVILSSSLHGVIVAEAYGIPAVFLDRGWGGGLKIRDYYESTDREPVMVRYDGLGNLRKYVDAALGAPPPRIDLAPLLAGLREYLDVPDPAPTATWMSFSTNSNHLGEVFRPR